MKINFYLPDFYKNVKLIAFLADLMVSTPEYFYENACISSVYGCFPGSIWNGGRVMLGSTTKQDIEYVLSELNERGIAIRYTFTNPLIEDWHIFDTFCNLCLELAENDINEVLVNSPILEDYIRKGYPKYKLISSTTKCLNDTASICDELKKDYKLVVLDSAMNNTEELFTLEPKDKIELIVNHYCADNCPKRREHYNSVGKSQLEFSETDFPVCKNINRDFFQIMKNRSFITTEQLYGKYQEAGFCHFKLDGRAFRSYKVLESIVYYLVKPDWRDKVRQIILKEVYKF